MIARHRAQAAADLAALAAAARLPAGADVACGQASAIADAMRVGVADCVVDGLDVVVTTPPGLHAPPHGQGRPTARVNGL